ncbi:MAG: lysophospholipid acyltransferase family protein [Rhodospirillales bacterium]|nr:lysophospholipid acyltransferase family protein [Rhodospirillales bacterium]
MKSLLRHPTVQVLLARLIGRYLSFALRTTRWTVDGAANLSALAGNHAAILTFWHEHLTLVPAFTPIVQRLPTFRPTPIHVLVSHHRDGRFIGEAIRRFGLDTVFGSSSRGGAAALRSLITLLGRGHIVAITPDGPRGPRREAAPGVAQLAALSGAPIVPVAARTARRIQLKTWDRMTIPLPFGRGVVVCGAPIEVPRAAWQDSLPRITAALRAVATRAEQLCPG